MSRLWKAGLRLVFRPCTQVPPMTDQTKPKPMSGQLPIIVVLLILLVFLLFTIVIKHEADTNWGQHPSTDLLDVLAP